jgi:hypothetical protein
MSGDSLTLDWDVRDLPPRQFKVSQCPVETNFILSKTRPSRTCRYPDLFKSLASLLSRLGINSKANSSSLLKVDSKKILVLEVDLGYLQKLIMRYPESL